MTGATERAEAIIPSQGTLYSWWVVAVLFVVAVVAYVDRFAITVLITQMKGDLGLSEVQMGTLLGPAFVIMYVIAAVPAGRIADRGSRRNLLMGGMVVWGLGTGLSAFASSFAAAVAGRAIVGLGLACFIPGAMSLVADYFPPAGRGKATSIVMLGVSLGSGLGVLATGALLETIAQGSLNVLSIGETRSDWAKVLLVYAAVTLALSALLLMVREPSRLVNAAHSGASPTPGETVQGDMQFSQFLKCNAADLLFVILPFVTANFIVSGTAAWLPALLERQFGESVANSAKIVGSLTLVASALGMIFGGTVGDYFAGKRPGGRLDATLLFAPLALVLAVACLAGSLTIAVIALTVFIFALSVVTISAFPAIQEATPAPLRGQMLGLYMVAIQIGGMALGTFAVGMVTDDVIGDPARLNLSLLLTMAPAWVVMVLAAWRGRRSLRRLMIANGSADPEQEQKG